MTVLPDTQTTEPDPNLDPGELIRRAVHRHFAGQIRLALHTVPCLPETPEARAERETAVIAIAGTLEPETHAETLFAIQVVLADARKAAIDTDLLATRGDRQATARLMAQAASFGRESRGALNALVRLQRERRRRGSDAASQADAAGRWVGFALTEALRSVPTEPPAAMPAAEPPAPEPKITRPPAPLPPSLLHLADRPDLPELAADGPHAPPGYCPWEPGCHTPMWSTMTHDHMTDEQQLLGDVWAEADVYCVLFPERAQSIRRHGGLPPDWPFEPPSPDVMHVLLRDNSSNFRWADAYQPRPLVLMPELLT